MEDINIPKSKEIIKLLNSKRDEILSGNFIPTKNNIISEIDEIKEYRIERVVSQWIKKNTPYENISDLKSYYIGKPFAILLKEYLDSKEIEIIKGEFIPTVEEICSFNDKIKEFAKNFERKYIVNLITIWIKNNEKIPFKSLRELKSTVLNLRKYKTTVIDSLNLIVNKMNIRNPNNIITISKNLYNNAEINGFNPNQLKSNNPIYLAAALLHFSTYKSTYHNTLSLDKIV